MGIFGALEGLVILVRIRIFKSRNSSCLRKAAMVRPLRRGGGVRTRPLWKKIFIYIFIYLSPKIVEKIFLCQNPFRAILRRKKQKPKKVPMTTKGLRATRGLSGRTTKKRTFFICGFPKPLPPSPRGPRPRPGEVFFYL